MVAVNSLNNVNLTVSKNGVVIEDLTETLNFNDNIFNVSLDAPTSEISVDINLAELEKALLARVDVSADYTATLSDSYIAVDTTDQVQITLFDSPHNGKKVTIKDETGNAYNKPITVLPGGSDLIDDKSHIVMRVDYIGLQFIYTNNQWRIV